MKYYQKTRQEYLDSKTRRESGSLDFLGKHCDIHGRLGNTVYRHKRNGERYSYPYIPRSKYAPTVLSRRSDCIMKTINRFSNVHQEGFKEFIRKLYYYTPYFVHPGFYGFTCNTFFKIRQQKEYFVQIDEGLLQKMKLAGRTKLEFGFQSAGEHTLRCYMGEELYCERKVTVVSAEEELERVYADWYDEHLTEILELPDPRFAGMEKYFRCVIPPNWILSLTGKCRDFVLFSTRNSHLDFGIRMKNYMYSRGLASHEHNGQSLYFLEVQPKVNHCWVNITADCRAVYEKFYNRWFEANYRKRWRATGPQNLWSKLVFAAARELGYDMKTLSPGNWLPGIDTLCELLKTAGFGKQGLSEEELRVDFFDKR
ncbi:MAG: hypothetical protein K9N06_11995 [Candidatus Cloacimonetes bacterium]|nr:hypothetical protein [Candidatus Cloacimonadota bacterium]